MYHFRSAALCSGSEGIPDGMGTDGYWSPTYKDGDDSYDIPYSYGKF